MSIDPRQRNYGDPPRAPIPTSPDQAPKVRVKITVPTVRIQLINKEKP